MSGFIVTIDGPAASGKSTVARLAAQKLDADFLDTGAMYRALTFAAMQDGIDLNDSGQLLLLFQKHNFKFESVNGKMNVYIDDFDVTSKIRNPQVTANVRDIASAQDVRVNLVRMQRDFAKLRNKIVTEGRDQGTVAFPDADFKFYLTASIAQRAHRRYLDIEASGIHVDIKEIAEAIEARDKSDQARTIGPLIPAQDAIMIDTTSMTIEEVVDEIVRNVRDGCSKKK